MTNVVHTDVKYVKALVWATGEKLQQDLRNYKEWRLRMWEWLDFNGLWCVIVPVKPEQVEQGEGDGKKVAVKDDATKAGSSQMYGCLEGICSPGIGEEDAEFDGPAGSVGNVDAGHHG